MDTLLAIPTANPCGLDAAMGQHFGHCDVFTLVKIVNDQVQEVNTLDNPPHEQGGCLAPVQLLASHGVQTLLAGGMGYRPLMAFNQVGIHVYYAGGLVSVKEGVDAFIQGKLPEFSQDHTCHGGR